MSRLPVPPLHQSLVRYLESVRPLLDDEQFAATRAASEEFEATDGPACQAALQQFADDEYEQGRNWMSQMWLEGYLAGRTPPTLTSNVGFELEFPPASSLTSEELGDPLVVAADAIARFAAVHLEYLRGEVEQHTTPRGVPLCMQQWRYLAGGARHPRVGVDEFIPGPLQAAHRSVVVLWQGRGALVTISDAEGRPLPRAALAAALADITDPTRPPEPAIGFADLSYLGGDQLAAHLDALATTDSTAGVANAEVYGGVVEAVFAVHLDDHGWPNDERLRRASFDIGRAWAYKPVTYLLGLADGSVGMHVEHSIVDGATLKWSIERAQQASPTTGAARPAPAPWSDLTWTITDDLAAAIAADVAAVRTASAAMTVRTVVVPTMAQHDIPLRLSHDAGQQFVLLFAQLATFERVRSTYEAVDMREYQAGRTECLRPNSSAAVALVQALIDGSAAPPHLHAALAAHRDAVIACKTGQAFDRHLFGLRFTAARHGRRPALFDDAGYRALTTDFLSTTSLGDQAQVVRYGFAPTSVGGIGVDYSARDGEYEFCLSFDADVVDSIDDFMANLTVGAERLFALVAASG